MREQDGLIGESSIMNKWLIILAVFIFTGSSVCPAAEVIVESPRQIPVVKDVDVVVVGGASAAVEAAVAAAESGAKVFLLAPRPYLGDDICGTMHLWLEKDERPLTELATKVFAPPPKLSLSLQHEGRDPRALDLTYKSSLPRPTTHPPPKTS